MALELTKEAVPTHGRIIKKNANGVVLNLSQKKKDRNVAVKAAIKVIIVKEI